MATGFNELHNPAHQVFLPAEQRVPYVFNSPHSGRIYPAEFMRMVKLNERSIRKSEDFHVDELFAGCVPLGSPMLVANFPRACLDVNREPWELDPAMFSGRLPDCANTNSARVAGGLGTIARIVSEKEEIYARKMPVEIAIERIETLYKPYHATLRHLLARTHVHFGYAVLIDCHSMPSSSVSVLGSTRPDFILGDRYATSCATQLVAAAHEFLTDLGYKVEINKPYAGGFITEHYGRPSGGLHALQIEINRSLYMDEVRLKKRDTFDAFKQDMDRFMSRLVSVPDHGFIGTVPLAAE